MQIVEEIAAKDKSLAQSIQLHPECEKLLALEGVATINCQQQLKSEPLHQVKSEPVLFNQAAGITH